MAGDGKILYSDLFDEKWRKQAIADFTELEKSATAKLAKIALAAKEIKASLPNYIQSGADLAKLNDVIRKSNTLQDEAARAMKEQKAAAEALDRQRQAAYQKMARDDEAALKRKDALIKKEEELNAKKAQKSVNDQAKKEAADMKALDSQRQKGLATMAKEEAKQRELNNVHKDSISALRMHTAAMVKERDSIDPLSARYKVLTKEIAANEKTLQKHDESIGRNQRHVGDYGRAFKGVGTALIGLGAAFGAGIGAIELFKGVIASTDATADFFKEQLSGLKEGMGFLARSIVNVDFTNLIQGFRDAFTEGKRYAETLDEIENRQRALGIQKSSIEGEIIDQKIIARNRRLDLKDREAAVDKIVELEAKKLAITKETTQRAIQNELDNAAAIAKVDKGTIQDFVANYDKYIDRINEGKKIQEETNALVTTYSGRNGVVIRDYSKRDAALKNLNGTQKEALKLLELDNILTDEKRDLIGQALTADINAQNEEKSGIASLSKLRNSLYTELIKQEGETENLAKKSSDAADKIKEMFSDQTIKNAQDLQKWIAELSKDVQDIPEIDINIAPPDNAANEKWLSDLASMQDFAKGAYDNTAKGQKEALDKQLADLEEFHRLGLINEEQYQAGLKELQKKGMQPKEWQSKLSEISGYFSDFAGQAINIWESLAKKQMDLAQKQVDIEQKKVDDLQTELDKQTELQKQGVANNSDLLRKQLEEQKTIRDQATKELAKAQKQQQRIDDAKQISSIITAVANIISGWSTIPIVGSILGIVAAGAMLIGWLALRGKSKATVPAMAKGTEFVDDATAPQGVDTIDAKLDRGERIVPKEENAKLKGIKNKDLARYSRLGQAIMEGNIDLYALNFSASHPTDTKIDFSELAHYQREGVSQQRETNSLLKKWKFVSGDGHKVVDMQGNIINYT